MVIHDQRRRIIDAVALISATEGYAALTVPHIANTAGVSHKTFYEHFTSKNQAFAAAFEVAGQQTLSAAANAYTAESDWPQAVHAALRSLARYLSDDPSFTRMTLVEVLAAGPDALTQRDQILQSFSLLLKPGQQYSVSALTVPAIAPEAISGGILEVLYFYISNDRAADLPQLVPQLTYIALAPFIGTEQAAKVANEPPSERQLSGRTAEGRSRAEAN
jgi:AcrR family transcriptional regulator